VPFLRKPITLCGKERASFNQRLCDLATRRIEIDGAKHCARGLDVFRRGIPFVPAIDAGAMRLAARSTKAGSVAGLFLGRCERNAVLANCWTTVFRGAFSNAFWRY